MKRRTALKNLLIVAGGVIVIPSCLYKEEAASIPLKYLKVNAEGEKLLAELVGTIIPTTTTPGAKDTYAHLFALNMVDDCFDSDVQDKFAKGVKDVDKLSKDRFNTTFVKCTPEQRAQIVADLEKRDEKTDDVGAFYKTLKRLTLQGYLNSKYVLTNVLKYEHVPGRYNGFFPVKPINHKV